MLDDCAAQPEPKDPQPVCGDGRVDGNEVCDDGQDNATYGHCGGRCDGPHLYCGDGRTDGPEQCDDGNTKAGDGCDEDCKNEGDDDAGMDMAPMSASGSGGAQAASGAGGSGTVAPPPKRSRADTDRADAGPHAGPPTIITTSDCGCRVVAREHSARGAAALASIALALFMRRRRRAQD